MAPHPFDPLSAEEIRQVVEIVQKSHNQVAFITVTLWEPRKQAMLEWLNAPSETTRPHRVADVVITGSGSKVYDAVVDLTECKILSWECMEGVQPMVSK